jgi:hypothetical protein
LQSDRANRKGQLSQAGAS